MLRIKAFAPRGSQAIRDSRMRSIIARSEKMLSMETHPSVCRLAPAPAPHLARDLFAIQVVRFLGFFTLHEALFIFRHENLASAQSRFHSDLMCVLRSALLIGSLLSSTTASVKPRRELLNRIGGRRWRPRVGQSRPLPVRRLWERLPTALTDCLESSIPSVIGWLRLR